MRKAFIGLFIIASLSLAGEKEVILNFSQDDLTIEKINGYDVVTCYC